MKQLAYFLSYFLYALAIYVSAQKHSGAGIKKAFEAAAKIEQANQDAIEKNIISSI